MVQEVQAAAARRRRAVRLTERHQQRAVAGGGAVDRGQRCSGVRRGLGVGRSRGTQVFQSLARQPAHGGIVETAFGLTLDELVHGYGEAAGRVGRCAPSRWWDRWGVRCRWTGSTCPWTTRAFAAAGAMVGHGGVVVFDDTVDMARQARFAMEFCAEESCGKCNLVPGRRGARGRGHRPARRGHRPG